MKQTIKLFALTILGFSLAINATYHDNLMEAIKNRNVTDAAQALNNDRSIINKKDIFGYTPLHRAVASHHPEIVEALLQAGADTNIIGTEEAVVPFEYIDFVEFDVQNSPEKLAELKKIRDLFMQKMQ